MDALVTLLQEVGNDRILIFTRTKHRAKKLAWQLIKTGLRATSLQGNLSQNQRQEAMSSFRSGRVKILVATDIAARGIDVSQISHVINFDMPDTAEAYIHRTGRTGRMTNLGTALSLATHDDQPMLRSIERF
jgi:ATP-dependent RNA helicase RhlE